MPAPAQLGTQLFSQKPPFFTGYHVVGGTWKESDAVKSEETQNENEEVFNVSFYDAGRDATCTMVSEAAQTRLSVGDLLIEGAGSPNPGFKWIVMKAAYHTFGTRSLKVDVTLIFREALQV